MNIEMGFASNKSPHTITLHTVQLFLYSNEKISVNNSKISKIQYRIVERGKINTARHKYMTAHCPCLVGTDTSIEKNSEIKLVSWSQTFHLREMIRLCIP
jgi:uncharacterized DUF497 family protein